jgi:uncharacterized membrane protein YjfL (UPF0719 family)
MEHLRPDVILAALAYAGMGVVIFVLLLFVVAKVLPFSLRKEIEQDQNTALAVIIGAAMLGIAHIIAAAVG